MPRGRAGAQRRARRDGAVRALRVAGQFPAARQSAAHGRRDGRRRRRDPPRAFARRFLRRRALPRRADVDAIASARDGDGRRAARAGRRALAGRGGLGDRRDARAPWRQRVGHGARARRFAQHHLSQAARRRWRFRRRLTVPLAAPAVASCSSRGALLFQNATLHARRPSPRVRSRGVDRDDIAHRPFPRVRIVPSPCASCIGISLALTLAAADPMRYFHHQFIRRHVMQWTTPSYTDLRLGFEITMYIANR
ncbi:Coenzyme PQQ synthesis protein A (modular protein) [Paraburkholderia tropica]|nr:Coenzyme PQQ synthesis protein A (modular protein) [Paraburkholderia tropica]